MTITSTTTFDIVGGTQSITFYQSASQVDQVSYSSSGITFAATSGFSASKSSALLYFQYLTAFNTLLSINFPVVQQSNGADWPVCAFEVYEINIGSLSINYVQTSKGNTVYDISYTPNNTTATFSARSSVTITLQEFFSLIFFINQYRIQVNLN